ncbi:MAG: hypothetical protein NT027_08240 [Proteobacteria bacterium]|nr:hypothetical protein [Pseudomonadota bacterium]
MKKPFSLIRIFGQIAAITAILTSLFACHLCGLEYFLAQNNSAALEAEQAPDNAEQLTKHHLNTCIVFETQFVLPRKPPNVPFEGLFRDLSPPSTLSVHLANLFFYLPNSNPVNSNRSQIRTASAVVRSRNLALAQPVLPSSIRIIV